MEPVKPSLISITISSNIGVFKNEYQYAYNNVFINGIDFRNGIVTVRICQFDIQSIDKVEVKSPPKSKTVGYKLKVAELASDKIPAYLTVEDVQPHLDEDDNMCWTNHEEIRGLYVRDVVQIDGSIDPVDYELVCLGKQIDNIDTPSIMTINVCNPSQQTEPKNMIYHR